MSDLLHTDRLYWWAVIALAILLFPVSHISYITSDASLYLGVALDLYNGEPYLGLRGNGNLSRGPGFPALVTLSYLLSGGDIAASAYIPRLAFSATLIILFAFTKRIYGPGIGLIAVLIAASTQPIHNIYTRLDIDAVLPALVMGAALLLLIGFEGRRAIPAFLSGLVLALSIITKETAVIFLPLGLAAWLLIPDFRNSITARKVVFPHYSGLLTIIGVWLSYVVMHGGSPDMLFGKDLATVASREVGGAGSLGLVLKWGAEAVPAIGVFLYDYVLARFRQVGAVLIVALVVLWVRALLKTAPRERYLAILLAAWLPMMVFMGMSHLRFGQNMIFYFFVFASIGSLAALVRDYMASPRARTIEAAIAAHLGIAGEALLRWRDRYCVNAWRNTALLLGLVVISYVPSYSIARANFMTGNSLTSFSYWVGPSFIPYDLPVTEIAAGEWLAQNANPGSVIIYQGRAIGIIRSQVRQAGGITPGLPGNITVNPFNENTWGKADGLIKPYPLFIVGKNYDMCVSAPDKTRRSYYGCLVSFAEETTLVSGILETGVDYIAISIPFVYQSVYFDNNPGFTKVAEYKGDGKYDHTIVYEVSSKISATETFQTRVGEDAIRILELLDNQDAELHEKFISQVISGHYGMESDILQQAKDGKIPAFKKF